MNRKEVLDMPTWLWVVIIGLGIFLALAFVGYLMGPQNGKALTKRDLRLLDRNARVDDAYLNSASHRADVEMMAEGTMDLARDHNASGIPATESLILAFEKMEHFERAQGNGAGLGPWLMQITGFLMEVGVLNRMDPAQIEAQLPGFSPAMLRKDPGALARVAGVRDLYAWPASAAPAVESEPSTPQAKQEKVPATPRSDYTKAQAVTLPDLPRREKEWFANLVAVVGPAASTGKTLVACNLAALLASFGNSVAVFESPGSGDVGRVFGCDPTAFSTFDLSDLETGNTDLKQVLPKLRDGLWVVPGVPEPSREGMLRGVAAAATEFDVVIIDSAPYREEVFAHSQSIATRIKMSGLTIVTDGGGSPPEMRQMLDGLERLRMREQCLVVRNGPESLSLGDPGPAWHVALEQGRVPAWPILPQDASISREDEASLLIVERAPGSPLAAQLTALAEAIAERLDP